MNWEEIDGSRSKISDLREVQKTIQHYGESLLDNQEKILEALKDVQRRLRSEEHTSELQSRI